MSTSGQDTRFCYNCNHQFSVYDSSCPECGAHHDVQSVDPISEDLPDQPAATIFRTEESEIPSLGTESPPPSWAETDSFIEDEPRTERRFSKRQRISFTILATLGVFFIYSAYISPGPGEWDREQMTEWIESKNGQVGLLAKLFGAFMGETSSDSDGLKVTLDTSKDTVEIFGVDFDTWEGTGELGTSMECTVFAIQNEEIGWAGFTRNCTRKSDLSKNRGTTVNNRMSLSQAHFFEGCGRDGASKVLTVLADSPAEDTPQTSSREEMIKALAEQINAYDDYQMKLENALSEADVDQEGDCKTVIEGAEEVQKALNGIIQSLDKKLREMGGAHNLSR